VKFYTCCIFITQSKTEWFVTQAYIVFCLYHCRNCCGATRFNVISVHCSPWLISSLCVAWLDYQSSAVLVDSIEELFLSCYLLISFHCIVLKTWLFQMQESFSAFTEMWTCWMPSSFYCVSAVLRTVLIMVLTVQCPSKYLSRKNRPTIMRFSPHSSPTTSFSSPKVVWVLCIISSDIP